MKGPEGAPQEQQLFVLHEKLKKQKPNISILSLALTPTSMSSQNITKELFKYKRATDEVGRELTKIIGISEFFDFIGFVWYFSLESRQIYLLETSEKMVAQFPFMYGKTNKLVREVKSKMNPQKKLTEGEDIDDDYGLSEEEKKEEEARVKKRAEKIAGRSDVLFNAAVPLANAFSEPQFNQPKITRMIDFHSRLIKSLPSPV